MSNDLDLTKAMAPKSDQLNAEDLLTGPRIFTVKTVTGNTDEQPVNIYLVESDRAYRPNKTMIRLIAFVWGERTREWEGRRFKLVRNPEVMWGGNKVGGIEVVEMSHMSKAVTVPLTVTRGRRKNYAVKPLQEPKPDVVEEGQVPPGVITNTQQAVAEGSVAAYLAHLEGRGAPTFILDYVRSNLPEADPQPPAGTDTQTGEAPQGYDPTAPDPSDIEPPADYMQEQN